jgi:ParB/RepB/Spo0J family partition protein
MTGKTFGRLSQTPGGATEASSHDARPRRRKPRIQKIPVTRIRPEDGLGRKRDHDGHSELRKSIEQFGVLTPITVRPAPDGSGDYLLIKGQGRTLACQMLGVEKIPAVVVDENFAEDEKVQQFLVENVARLRMRPIDRALLIARARRQGEETADVARRFGVTPATVRRLEIQLDGASKHEVTVLKQGRVNLALHSVIAKHVDPEDRGDVMDAIAKYSLRTKDVDVLFTALGWSDLVALGREYRTTRLLLIDWACAGLSKFKSGSIQQRLSQLAARLPLTLDTGSEPTRMANVR